MKRGRNPCCNKQEMNIGAWSAEEDKLLSEYILSHGEGKWRKVASTIGLKRCGKSCRLRWLNYLKPGIKRGNISLDEEDLIIRLHKLLGNRWSLIAGRLPRRTDNEIKNYWNTKLSKKIEKNDHPIHSKRQSQNSDDNTSQSLSPNATSSVKPKMELQQRESEDRDKNHIKVSEEFYQNNSEGSSLFEGKTDLNMLSFDPKDLMLDFEVGELYISEFFE